jgi:hypothetical protein
MHHLNNNKKNNDVVITSATLAILATIIVIVVSSGATTEVVATTTTSNTTTTTTTTSSSGLELSPQPVWEEQATTTGVTPINQTHSIATFIGNGTLTVPDTGETIPMTNNGTAFISPLTESGETVSAYGKENVFSEDDDDTTAITFYEIVRYNPTTLEGKGITIAVFDANATGSLAPFNDMMIVGTHEEDPDAGVATITLWEWESGIPLPTGTTTMEESPPSPMKTTTMTNATTTSDANATTATDGEQQQQQQQTTPTIPAPLLE